MCRISQLLFIGEGRIGMKVALKVFRVRSFIFNTNPTLLQCYRFSNQITHVRCRFNKNKLGSASQVNIGLNIGLARWKYRANIGPIWRPNLIIDFYHNGLYLVIWIVKKCYPGCKCVHSEMREKTKPVACSKRGLGLEGQQTQGSHGI